MRYLLDTNVVSDMIRNPNGKSARRYRTLGKGNVSISVIVAAELRFGAIRRGDRTLSGRLDEFIKSVDILPFEPPADACYGELRARLEAAGALIGAVDLFIAAHALALDRILVTDNEDEFARVEGLAIENWLR